MKGLQEPLISHAIPAPVMQLELDPRFSWLPMHVPQAELVE